MISRSIEMLSHFRCEECKKWFSIGDAENDIADLFCPRCGINQKVEIIQSMSTDTSSKPLLNFYKENEQFKAYEEQVVRLKRISVDNWLNILG